MDQIVANLIPGLLTVLDPWNLAIILCGSLIGIILGVLPGFGPSQALALLFPFTFVMSPETAVLFFIAIYTSSEYGGSIPAILIRTPGNAAAAMTVLDGYPMTQNGKAYRALQISLMGGTVGGFVSSVIFIFSASGLAWIGLQFGPGELFAVGVLGLSLVGTFFGESALKGFIATSIGLLLATVGPSGFAGTRFTFDMPALSDGLPVVIVITAFLAFPEILRLMAARATDDAGVEKIALDKNDKGLSLRDVRNLVPSMMRGSVIGTFVGVIPGPGAAVASMVAYNEEKRWSKHPEKFGTGVDEGVCAPETANNAIVAGGLIPSLALGIPGSAAIAILLGMLISKGVVPGPIMFQQNGLLVATIFLGLLVCNVAMVVVGLAGIRVFSQIARVPQYLLAPFVLVTILIGIYVYESFADHVIILMALGVFAFWLEKLGFSVVPVVLGFVMGPIIENNLMRALSIKGGDLAPVLMQPLVAIILSLAAITIFLALRQEVIKFRARRLARTLRMT